MNRFRQLWSNLRPSCWFRTNAARYVVPADDKNARLIISQILLDTFNDLEMAYPKTTAKRRSELKAIRKEL